MHGMLDEILAFLPIPVAIYVASFLVSLITL